MTIALDAGAEDIKTDSKNYEIIIPPQEFEKVKQAIQEKEIKLESADMTMLPSSNIKLAGNEAKQLLSLIEALEEHEDVQQVYANFDIPDEVLDQIASTQD